MNATVAIIAVVLAAAALAYLAMPDGPPVAGTRLAEMPEEGNGLAGRFVGGLSDMARHPQQLGMAALFISAVVAGLYVYWRSIED